VANPLRIQASDLLRRPGTDKPVEVQVPLADLGVEGDERFPGGADVRIRLRLESLSDGIVVDGTLFVPWQGICRRCLIDIGGVTECEVHELYQRTITDPEAFELDGDQLDLRPLVRELVLLDAPSTPLCRPDCAGLCLTCGTNLNEAQCSCAAPPADPRWGALEGLQLSDGTDSRD
jgi:uncharacterized protein